MFAKIFWVDLKNLVKFWNKNVEKVQKKEKIEILQSLEEFL